VSPDQLFSLANVLALAAWLGLPLLPHVAAIRNVISAAVVPCLIAAVYIVILVRFFNPGAACLRCSLAKGLKPCY
jgi:hypothetical protein